MGRPQQAEKLGIEPAEVPLAMGLRWSWEKDHARKGTHEARLGHRNLGGRGWREDTRDKK